MSRVASYRVVLPQPWVRVPVGRDTEARVHAIVEARAQRLPKSMPPDDVGPWKRDQERRLLAKVKSTAEYGGIDVYFPADAVGSILLGASFVVSGIRPPGQLPEELSGDAAVGAVLAELLREPGTRLVSVAGQAWVRSQRVLEPDLDKAPGVDVPMCAVSYVTALPDDPEHWVLIEFSGTGDGDPASESTTLVIELFDAIVSTWRWISADDTRWADLPDPDGSDRGPAVTAAPGNPD